MTPEQFVYWLQGYVEVTGNPATTSSHPTDAQWQVIKDHLQTVFHKVTPDRSGTITVVPSTPFMPNGDGGSGTYFPSTSPTIIC